MLIHIGYVKTGSTWLQNNLFFNHKQTVFQSIVDRIELSRVAFASPKFGWSRSEALRNICADGIRQAKTNGLYPVMSHECLAGNPVNGGYHAVELLQVLYEAFPHARILVLFREQRDMLASVYNEYVNGGGVSTLQRYLNPPDKDWKLPMFRSSFLEYDALVGEYIDKFGEANVLAMPFELLRADTTLFVSRLAEFCGVELPNDISTSRVRASKSACRVEVERLLNRFCYSNRTNPVALFHKPGLRDLSKMMDYLPQFVQDMRKRSIRRYIDDWCGDRYVDSNLELSNLLDIDLKRLGYR